MSQQYKVLVVDDDLKLRSLLERYLTEQGFVVRGVANGEQADRLLTRERGKTASPSAAACARLATRSRC